MDKIDVSEDFFSGVRYVYASRENGKMTLLPNDNASELLLDIKNAFSVDTTVRKAACDLSNIVLTRLNEKFGENHLDFCAIFGFIDDPSTKLSVLRLKGTAAGLHPNGMLKWESINVGEGFIGQAALNKMPLLTNDLRNDPRASTPIEKSLAQLADKLALLAYPLILASGELAGVLVVGKFHAGELSEKFFKNPDLNRIINWLVPHIATTLDNAKWVSKAQLQKKYLEHERRIGAIIRQFYNEAIAERNLKKLMEAICSECMNILNSGKPEQPFYQNFLFYE